MQRELSGLCHCFTRLSRENCQKGQTTNTLYPSDLEASHPTLFSKNQKLLTASPGDSVYSPYGCWEKLMCKKSTACDCTWSPMEDECHIKRVGELVPAIPPGLHARISSGCHHCAPPHPHLIQYTGADLIFQALCLEAFMLQPMGFSGRHTKPHGPRVVVCLLVLENQVW